MRAMVSGYGKNEISNKVLDAILADNTQGLLHLLNVHGLETRLTYAYSETMECKNERYHELYATPLVLALELGKWPIADLLLNRGAELAACSANHEDFSGWFEWSIVPEFLVLGSGDAQIIRSMLSRDRINFFVSEGIDCDAWGAGRAGPDLMTFMVKALGCLVQSGGGLVRGSYKAIQFDINYVDSLYTVTINDGPARAFKYPETAVTYVRECDHLAHTQKEAQAGDVEKPLEDAYIVDWIQRAELIVGTYHGDDEHETKLNLEQRPVVGREFVDDRYVCSPQTFLGGFAGVLESQIKAREPGFAISATALGSLASHERSYITACLAYYHPEQLIQAILDGVIPNEHIHMRCYDDHAEARGNFSFSLRYLLGLFGHAGLPCFDDLDDPKHPFWASAENSSCADDDLPF
jgi:hypothetical protein